MAALVRAAPVPALLLAALACSGPAQVRYEEQLEAATPSLQHTLHSERLDGLMRAMDRLVQERLPRDMDVRAAQTFQAEEIARVAQAVADSAEQIPGAAGAAALDPARRREFLALAEELTGRARQLAKDASWLQPAAVGERIAAIESACAACHTRFGIRGGAGAGD